MKEASLLEIFCIARDLAVADHQHRLRRSDMAKGLDALRRADENTPPTDPPTIHELFVESYRFMASELSALQDTDKRTTFDGEA